MTLRRLLSITFLFILLFSALTWAAQNLQKQNTGISGTLTFEQRVAYQRAIEEVYWHHRIWPKENKSPKPSLNQVMPDSVIRAKVEDYLKKSNALAENWQRPLHPEQLQAEINRMIKQTKQPQILRELFAALDNNPQIIAECLARPSLADRFIHNMFAGDERFHGDLKRRIESELRITNTIEAMRALSGTYRETIVKKASEGRAESEAFSAASLTLESSEWENWEKQLKERFGKEALPLRKMSGLKEEKEHYSVTAVLENDGTQVRIATVEWKKQGFEEWWKITKQKTGIDIVAPQRLYSISPIRSSLSCIEDTWSSTFVDLPTGRYQHTAVWTGTELIVWGGFDNGDSNTGGRYNPSTDTWAEGGTGITNVPSRRRQHTAIWTGTEMIVWGGVGNNGVLSNGGRYDPASGTWVAGGTSPVNAPSARFRHTAIWTGTEMIIWGGGDLQVFYLNTGGRFSPSNNTWVAGGTSTTDAPSTRASHTAVWTNTEMIIWGGDNGSPLNTGGRYDPSANTWSSDGTSITDVPEARDNHTAVWTGTEMIVWGGFGTNVPLNTGGRYDPSTNTWVSGGTSPAGAPAGRDRHTTVWTGTEMIVWGGFGNFFPLNTGGRYDPTTDAWVSGGINTSNAPSGRYQHTAVWTGMEMIVWGGDDGSLTNTGGRYDSSTNTWTSGGTGTTDVPSARSVHTAVWTGTEMIIWGGHGIDPGLNTGGRYIPATDAWDAGGTSSIDAPAGRYTHTAVWTGTKMIIWGGTGNGDIMNSGGRYDPAADTWAAGGTSTINVPGARLNHTMVWTGTEMIVWGGNGNTGYQNTGGRYDPETDTWVGGGTSIINAPDARNWHTAVWTGAKMIVWGGFNNSRLNSGGQYDPANDTWAAGGTSITNVPDARTDHTAIWTGTEMIVWGGYLFDPISTGGRYDPATDTWAAGGTSTTNVPDARASHSAVWTGTEMIVWGGVANSGFNSGGRYDPATDSWAVGGTSTTNVPDARVSHSAVWTGTEMIVWGGENHSSFLNSGGRYCPETSVVPTVSISDATVAEGNSGTVDLNFTVTLSETTTQVVTVNFETADDTAKDADNDFEPETNSITILAGQTQGTISITVNGDTKYEHNETFFVNLTGATNATIDDNQGTGTINNDDTAPVITISDNTVIEPLSGSGFTDANFTVTITPVSGADVSVNYATANNTAIAGGDYTAISTTTLTIPAGSTQGIITVQVLGDGHAETAETYFVNLTSPVNATIGDAQGTGTIENRTPAISISDVSLTEGNSGKSNATFLVTPSFVYDAAISVNYTTIDATAVQPGDYTSRSGTLNIPASSASRSIDVPVVGDKLKEADETFTVQLSNPTNASILDGTGIVTIINDDAGVVLPTLSVDDVSVNEGNSGSVNARFTVTQSFVTGSDTTVKFATANGTAKKPGDYVGTSVVVTIPAGSTTMQVIVPVHGDILYEPDETFKVNLTNPFNATIADNQGIGTILNDDAPL